MNNFQLTQYILIDKNVRMKELKKSGGLLQYTNNGTKLYPLGIYLPVIRKGEGCIGLGIVRQVTMTETTTRISFEYISEISVADAKAYYSLYRGQISMTQDSSADIYDNVDDMFIPGAVSSVNINASRPGNNLRVKKGDDVDRDTDDEVRSILSRQRDFNSFYDDDNDDDDY